MIELKPCPFCGGQAEMHKRWNSIEETAYKKSEIPSGAKFIYKKVYPEKEVYFYKRKFYIPRCVNQKCTGRSSKPFFDEQEAMEAWNRRVNDER